MRILNEMHDAIASIDNFLDAVSMAWGRVHSGRCVENVEISSQQE
jgi:hypothetical protein